METTRDSGPAAVLKGLLALLAGAMVSALAATAIFIFIILWAPSEIPGAPVGPNPFLPYLLPAAALFLVCVFVITAAHAFILGVPLALVFNHYRLIRWWTCLLGGFMIGLPLTLVTLPKFVLWGGGLGAAGGFTAWMVWYILSWLPRAIRPPMPDAQLAEPPASA